MQKTIKQWLEELPEPYRSKALKNHASLGLTTDVNYENLSDAINSAFSWGDTFEGHAYWSNVARQLHPFSEEPFVLASEVEEPRTLVVLDQDELPEPPIFELKSTVPVDDEFVLDWPKPQPVSDFPNDGPYETYVTDGTVVFEKQHQEPFLQVEGHLMTEGVLKHLSEGLTQHEAIEADALDRSYDKIRQRLDSLPPKPPKIGVEQDSFSDRLFKAFKPDPVNHPSHYTKGSIECIDALAAATEDLKGMEAVCTANAIKYLWRWKHKNGVEDLKKAVFYTEKLIKELEK